MPLQELLLSAGARRPAHPFLKDRGSSCSGQRKGCEAAAAVHAVHGAPCGSQADHVVSCSEQAGLCGAVAAVLLCHVLHGGKFGQVLARDCADAALGPELTCAGVAAEAAGQTAQCRRKAGSCMQGQHAEEKDG